MKHLTILLCSLMALGCQTMETSVSALSGTSNSASLVTGEKASAPLNTSHETNGSVAFFDLGVTAPIIGKKRCPVIFLLYPLFLINPSIFSYACGFKEDKEQAVSWGLSAAKAFEKENVDDGFEVEGVGGGIFIKARLPMSKTSFLSAKLRVLSLRSQSNLNNEMLLISRAGSLLSYDIGWEGYTGFSASLQYVKSVNYYEGPMTHPAYNPYDKEQSPWERHYYGLSLNYKIVAGAK